MAWQKSLLEAGPPNPSHLCRMRGRQPASRALHKRLAPGRCVERRAAQKDARRARRGRQRRRGRRRGQTRPTAQPTGGGGGRQPRAGGCAVQTRQNEHLKKLCNTMNVDHSLSRDKTMRVDTFIQQREAVSRVWSGLGTDLGAAEEATAAVSPLFSTVEIAVAHAQPYLCQ